MFKQHTPGGCSIYAIANLLGDSDVLKELKPNDQRGLSVFHETRYLRKFGKSDLKNCYIDQIALITPGFGVIEEPENLISLHGIPHGHNIPFLMQVQKGTIMHRIVLIVRGKKLIIADSLEKEIQTLSLTEFKEKYIVQGISVIRSESAPDQIRLWKDSELKLFF